MENVREVYSMKPLEEMNVIGRIDFSQEAMLDEIEERIWREGQEKVRIERA